MNTQETQIESINISGNSYQYFGKLDVVNNMRISARKALFQSAEIKIGGTAYFNINNFYCQNSVIYAKKIIFHEGTRKYLDNCKIIESNDLLVTRLPYSIVFGEIKPKYSVIVETEISLIGSTDQESY